MVNDKVMAGARCVQTMMARLYDGAPMKVEQAVGLWSEVRKRLGSQRSISTILEVESCTSGKLDTHPRDILRDAIAFVLTGREYWEEHYPGSDFLFLFLKECIARNYIESDYSLGAAPEVRFSMVVSDGVKAFKQTVVHARHYDALLAETVDLRRQLAEKEVAANRWDALLGCKRMRVVGHAGFKPQEDPERNKPHLAGHRHIGVDFWTHHDADDGEKEYAQEMITRFADQVMANLLTLTDYD
jgi:hypothetical protein